MDMALHIEQSQQVVETKLQESSPNSDKRVDTNSSRFQTEGKVSKKDPKKHKLIFLDEGLPDGTELAYFSREKAVLKGIKKGCGIFCFCCETQISPSEFEKHAGYEYRRKPYENIFLLNGPVKGRSLSEYAFELKQECKDATRIPFKKRRCINCRKPAISEGQNDVVACVLCSEYDFCETGFNDRTAIICNQCEKEYHIGCLREKNMAHLKELPHGNWFCSVGCEKLHSDLEALATYGPRTILNSDAQWILLRGKCASGGNKLLLDEAVKIFHECFNRILDPGTGQDIISSMAYGEEMSPSDFSGVRCAMLTINSKVVTAGLFRIFGHEVAELPIVATSQPNQGKGYFRLFLTYFETLLSEYKIKKLVLPAADKVQAMWIERFGFSVVTDAQLREYQQVHTAMITFKGTTLLEKVVTEQLN
uniref:increased DNA methylation 1-like isoform X2 n=1 Tax=Erigeron canadensis TaxID=72917 RepID=UPI001CB98C82|nr:increased DNA methylation 1-like isoform X2 [Erigeron canadensis]